MTHMCRGDSATALGVSGAQVRRTAELLKDEATVPFIVRYRQEATGGLDEAKVRGVLTALRAHEELEARRLTVLRQLEKASAALDRTRPAGRTDPDARAADGDAAVHGRGHAHRAAVRGGGRRHVPRGRRHP